MRVVVLSILVLSFAAGAAELKNLGPENVSLSRRLLKLLGPESNQEAQSEVDEKESLSLNHRGTHTRSGKKSSESNLVNR